MLNLLFLNGVRRKPKYRSINHVLGTGQSLSVGDQGYPISSTSQPYDNLRFIGGVRPKEYLGDFLPLIEGPVYETMSSAFANILSRDTVGYRLLVSLHGVGATLYAGLKKGTAPYASGMAQATAASQIASQRGDSYYVSAVTVVHGESDTGGNNTHYLADLVEWQSDYDNDVRAITGQSEPIPIIHSQCSSFTRFGSATASLVVLDQLKAHVTQPGKIILVGPKYHLSYADGVHLTGPGYLHMGEDYAKAYRRVLIEGKTWEPVRPIEVSRVGAVVTVKFAAPVLPLVFDTTLVSNPGNYGFEFSQTGPTPPAISNVTLVSADTVEVELAAVPTGTNMRIRYAYTSTLGANAGPTTGARGNLRDSDATVSRYGYPLHNWCCHFNEAVP